MARPETDPQYLCGTHGGRCKDGKPCEGTVIAGTKRCRMHAGKRREKAKAEGWIVRQLQVWGLDGHSTMADAGEVLLKLVTQSAARCELYGTLLGQAYRGEAAGESLEPLLAKSGVAALIGYRYGVDREGNRFQQEEAIRGLARLEAEERDRCANFAAKAVAAGLAERQVRMAEAQGMMMVTAIRAILDELQLSPDQQQRAGEIVARQLRAISVGAPHSIDSVATEDAG